MTGALGSRTEAVCQALPFFRPCPPVDLGSIHAFTCKVPGNLSGVHSSESNRPREMDLGSLTTLVGGSPLAVETECWCHSCST